MNTPRSINNALAASCYQPAEPLLFGNKHPLGIPALFLADPLARGLAPDQVLSQKTSLLTEYAGAEGYAYSWGQLVEQSFGGFVIWRIVPVEIWERLEKARKDSRLFIWEAMTELQPMVRPKLEAKLPAGLLMTGCQGAGRRNQHALFSLLLIEKSAMDAVRQWLSGTFLHELLPELLVSIERHLAG